MKTSEEQRTERVSWAAIKKVNGKDWAYPGTVANSEESALRRLVNLVYAASQQKKFKRPVLLQRLRRDGWRVGQVQITPLKAKAKARPKAAKKAAAPKEKPAEASSQAEPST